MPSVNYEGDKDKVYSTEGRGETFADVLARRLNRRSLVRGAAVVPLLAVTGPRILASPASGRPAAQGTPVATPAAGLAPLGFTPIALDASDATVVAAGHQVTPFLKWGDPIFADAPEFDVANQTAESQAKQFGYNCDWLGFLPLPQGSTSSNHGLLVSNHEYTSPELMFAGYLTPNPAAGTPTPDGEEAPEFLPSPTQEIVDVELEAHGLSVVEIQRNDAGQWEVVLDSQYNRRITGTTPMEVTGPAAGADWLTTTADPNGTTVSGTLNNCAGGVTPWGTIVTGEENFNQYFANLLAIPDDSPVYALHERYGLPEEASERGWELFHDRFDLAKEPNEPFRFGWGVEIDPYDPESVPRKRTALGRNKHEGHTSAVTPGGQVAIYSGDDERFEYAYKFVTAGSYNPDDRAANMTLLDEGTLYVAKFNDDGTGEWLPLVQGENGLDESNGFTSQADVVINTRAASDLLGATKMDRPEDFETNPVNQKVYLVCTNNNQRTLEETGKANPRTDNVHGHIIEITEDNDDHAGATFTWEMFLLAGDPAQGSTWFAGFDADLVSPISSPDNITFDLDGNLWISTDGLANNLPGNDGLFAAPTAGEERGYLRQFFSAVPGAEVSGPVFTPDNTALFTSVQHPGEGGTFEEPLNVWPEGEGFARPTVVVIQAENGGRVGGGASS